ncbi:MAG: DUF465 domain-containing protein [Rhizobiales bacterium]|nr:DUF465 domain-containing protein [Hyphomicrobiales bacterium]
MRRITNSDGVTVKKDQDELRARLTELRQEHRDLDVEIDEMIATGDVDQINLQRLKKHKLHLKDQITTLENQLLPDIIA